MFDNNGIYYKVINEPYFEKPFFSDYERRYKYLLENMDIALDFLENFGDLTPSSEDIDNFYEFVVNLVVMFYESAFEELSYFLVYKIYNYTKKNNISFNDFLIKASKINQRFTNVVLDIAKQNKE